MADKLADIIELELMQTFLDNKQGDKFPIAQLRIRLIEKFKSYAEKELLSRLANNSHLEHTGKNVHRVIELETVSNVIHDLD